MENKQSMIKCINCENHAKYAMECNINNENYNKIINSMKDKKEIEFGLLIFAVTTILWCTAFGYMIGKIDRDYKQEIKILKENCK